MLSISYAVVGPADWIMLRGHRVPRQKLGAYRNRPCGGNQAANRSHKFVSRQDGCASGSTRRKDVEELEESPLRKAKGARGGKINPTKQAMARRFLNQNGMHTEQDDGLEGRGLSLTGGDLWQR